MGPGKSRNVSPASSGRAGVAVRLAPAVFVYDIGERRAADRPETPSSGSRSAGGHRNARRRASQAPLPPPSRTADRGRQRRAETERPGRQQHVLDRRVDRRTGGAGRRGAAHAGHDPYRRFMDVVGQILGGVEHPPKPLGVGSGGWFAGAISRADHLVPGPLVVGPDRLLDPGTLTTRNRQRCILPPEGAQTPASSIFRISFAGTGSGFSRCIDRVVAMISNRSGFCSGIASSRGQTSSTRTIGFPNTIGKS